MKHSSHSIPSRIDRGGVRRVFSAGAWCAFAAVLIVIGPSCSSDPGKNYKVLSFFFDGVPDPNAPQLAEGWEEGATPGAAPKFLSIIHKPYADGQCNACHEGDTSRFESFKKLGSDVCMKCHEKVIDQYPIMHGPVAAGECNLCHNPHESSVKHLLNEDAPAVCAQCHINELLPSEPPEHLDRKRNCFDCHTGHGGEKHGMLRSDYASTQPAQGGAP